MKRHLSFTPYINSKWVKDNIKANTIKLLKEHIGEIFFMTKNLAIDSVYDTKSRSDESKIKQMDHIEL